MVKGFAKFAVGRVGYVCWCDEHGKVLDDGTVTRFAEDRFRVTAADPALAWLARQARGLDVAITDVSRTLAALALQGPRSRAVLRDLLGATIDDLKFFRALETKLPGKAGADLVVTRTGYTGDLGYELWVANEHALALWDALFEAGSAHGLLPLGLDALDVARVEAGFLLGGCDYTSARRALIPRQQSTPYELGFDWMVELEREPFVGQAALARAAAEGPARRFVGLEIDWEDFERIYERYALPPHIETGTSREGVPLFRGGRQVGYATSRSWSPLLKQYLALGTVDAALSAPGNELEIDVTCEHERHRARVRVRKLPFYDPERKKA
jgi:aminomethyltransferase